MIHSDVQQIQRARAAATDDEVIQLTEMKRVVFRSTMTAPT